MCDAISSSLRYSGKPMQSLPGSSHMSIDPAGDATHSLLARSCLIGAISIVVLVVEWKSTSDAPSL
ncbi:hypothetical protein, partial [Campylobacter coli]|uniref:hypothetical protein n=1 Tax=Campylobacter coli TaxID=195 RepID=UPI003CF53422